MRVSREKRQRKLDKDLASEPGKVKITVRGGDEGIMIFDPAELPDEIQRRLVPFGLGHKLGDAAAGRAGKDAEDAILKVWEGLLAGEWTIRAPAVAKVSLNDVATNFANLSEEDKAAARAIMEQLGIKLPGM